MKKLKLLVCLDICKYFCQISNISNILFRPLFHALAIKKQRMNWWFERKSNFYSSQYMWVEKMAHFFPLITDLKCMLVYICHYLPSLRDLPQGLNIENVKLFQEASIKPLLSFTWIRSGLKTNIWAWLELDKILYDTALVPNLGDLVFWKLKIWKFLQ